MQLIEDFRLASHKGWFPFAAVGCVLVLAYLWVRHRAAELGAAAAASTDNSDGGSSADSPYFFTPDSVYGPEDLSGGGSSGGGGGDDTPASPPPPPPPPTAGISAANLKTAQTVLPNHNANFDSGYLAALNGASTWNPSAAPRYIAGFQKGLRTLNKETGS